MAITIAFANIKGGVGKSVSAIITSTILSDRGYKVLLVDCDPQRNSSAAFKCRTDGVPTLYDIMFSGYAAERCIQHTELGDCIASDQELTNIDSMLKPGPGMYKHLKKSLTNVEKEYDFIIFDTPPVRGALLGNVLYYVKNVCVPLKSGDLFCAQGLLDMASVVEEFQEDNEGLKIIGLLKVLYKKQQKLTKEVDVSLEQYAKKMHTKVFKTTIRESVRCQEAIMLREKISTYAPKSTVAKDYNDFVDELLREVM